MKKILIVDDSAFMRSILKDLLLAKEDAHPLVEEVEVFEADGKDGALKQFKKIKPDVILLDVVMRESETEGVEFLAEIRDEFGAEKIIMISSTGQSAIIEKCKQLGITKYLSKPFEREQIIEAVNSILM